MVQIFNTQLTQLDLSSLEEIRGLGITSALNSELCYVGDLEKFVVNNESRNCIFIDRKDEANCSKY